MKQRSCRGTYELERSRRDLAACLGDALRLEVNRGLRASSKGKSNRLTRSPPMIDDPPLITLRRKVPRPTGAQLAELNGTPTGFIIDALGGRGAVAPDIKPVITEQASFCGVAVTCHVAPADNLAVFAALPLLQAGDVIVAAADGYRETAVVGDLVLGMARNLGAVAFVTDGCVRDIPGIREVGLPCFSAGVTPASPV